ncbi:hypothetical protein [Dactylosporangium sp. NPDC006015]|uniref:hypothetical protein n=1 Tax=Dactylosporangium sp. NPDC006015 TaxID=3154576 RepID=UPI0033B4E01B
MTEPTDPHVTAAVDRGDVDWLAAHVDGTACPPALLARLARHGDPSLRLLAVQWLGARLIGGDVDEDLLRLLGTDETPEVALATATLFQRHGRLPPSAWPRWREHGPVAVVRVAWLRAELLHLPGRLPAEPPGEPLLQAVAGLACADASDPPRLLDELTGRDDPVLHGAALRLCREGLRAAVLAPAAARRILGRLLDSGTPAVVAGALTELAEPWAAVDPVAPHRLRALLAPAPTGPGVSPAGVAGTADVASAAVAAAARHGLREPLLDAGADVRVPPRVRQRALEALGELLDREHIPAVVGLGATDPLLLGPAAVACLTTMHHRGLIVAAADAAGVVSLALADHAIPAGDVAALLYTARHATRAALLAGPAACSVPGSSAGADDGSGADWARRLDLLVALARQGAPDLDIGGDVAALLPRAAEPEPFLAAIRALRHAPAEDAVLAALPRAPAAALHALEAVGGDRTVAVLADGLAQDLPFLRPWRHQALELCWLLQPDPARRHALLLRLDPAALPDRIAADLGRPDERELAVLRARATPDRPLQALIWLAGHAAAVDDVTELLSRIVAELALAYDTRGNPPDEQHRLPADLAAVDPDRDRPAATKRMPVVPQEALAALQGLGRRLYRDGRIRPVCLLDAADHAADHAADPDGAAGGLSGPYDAAGRFAGRPDAAQLDAGERVSR